MGDDTCDNAGGARLAGVLMQRQHYTLRMQCNGQTWQTPACRTLEEAKEQLRELLSPHMDRHWREIVGARVQVLLPGGKWEDLQPMLCRESLRELVTLLDEPADARPLELGAAVERAKAALEDWP